ASEKTSSHDLLLLPANRPLFCRFYAIIILAGLAGTSPAQDEVAPPGWEDIQQFLYKKIRWSPPGTARIKVVFSSNSLGKRNAIGNASRALPPPAFPSRLQGNLRQMRFLETLEII
ncbi:MAG: hypothetical protein ACK5NG_09805, partial [Chthoniobacterales bacterium]